uniref:Tc1-like transposase DDE domain-containing protein n=1 Tax=Dicentrarchus labrax TaxID=13489 RepID=A0A8C4DEX4_DICLA
VRNMHLWDEQQFCLRQLDRRVKVWRRCGERYADCCTNRITSFGGGSVMVWGGISLTGKTRLVITGGNLNAERYGDEILQPVAIPYLHSLGPNSILQDDNVRPHRTGFIRDYLQYVGVERMEWPASSPDLNPDLNTCGISLGVLFVPE